MPEHSPATVACEKPDRWVLNWAVIGLAAAVFLMALGSIWLTRESGRVAAIWPGNALVLFAMRRRPDASTRMLLASIAATFLANLVVGDPAVRGLGLAACNGLEVFLCAWLMSRVAGREVDLASQRNMIAFLAAAALAPVASGLGAAFILSAGHWDTILGNLKAWYAPDVLGLLIVTPALLALRRDSLQELGHALRRPRGWASAAVLVVTLALVFGQTRAPLYFLIPPALILIAFQLNLAGAALAVLLVAVTGVAMTLMGQGGVSAVRVSLSEKLDLIQVFMATLTVTILPVAGAIQTRRKLETDLRESNRQSALAKQIAGVGHWRNDLITGHRTWSDRIFEIQGMTREGFDPYGGLGFELYHADDQPRMLETVARVVATGEPFDIKVRLCRADDGRERVVVFQGTFESDDGPIVLAGEESVRAIGTGHTNRVGGEEPCCCAIVKTARRVD